MIGDNIVKCHSIDHQWPDVAHCELMYPLSARLYRDTTHYELVYPLSARQYRDTTHYELMYPLSARQYRDTTCLLTPRLEDECVYMMHLAQEVNHSVFVGIVSHTSIKLSFWLKIWNILTCMPVTARRKTDVQIHLDNMLSMYIYTWKWDYSVIKPLYNTHFTYFYSRIHWLSMYISWRAKRMFVFLN